MNLKNINNEDQRLLDRVFHETPKAVFAAIACSAYRQLGITEDELKARIAYEWTVLHYNEVVDNKPTKHVRDVAWQYNAPLEEDAAQ